MRVVTGAQAPSQPMPVENAKPSPALGWQRQRGQRSMQKPLGEAVNQTAIPRAVLLAIPLPPEPDAIWEGGEGRKSFEKADVGLTWSFKFYLTRHLPLPYPQENLSHAKTDCLKFEQRVPSLIDNASILNGDESPRPN